MSLKIQEDVKQVLTPFLFHSKNEKKTPTKEQGGRVEGWLNKKSGKKVVGHHKMQRRYFVLEGPSMRYYKNPKDEGTCCR